MGSRATCPPAALGGIPTSGLILGKFFFAPRPQTPSVLWVFRVQAAGMLREAAVVQRKGALDLESEDLSESLALTFRLWASG